MNLEEASDLPTTVRCYLRGANSSILHDLEKSVAMWFAKVVQCAFVLCSVRQGGLTTWVMASQDCGQRGEVAGHKLALEICAHPDMYPAFVELCDAGACALLRLAHRVCGSNVQLCVVLRGVVLSRWAEALFSELSGKAEVLYGASLPCK